MPPKVPLLDKDHWKRNEDGDSLLGSRWTLLRQCKEDRPRVSSKPASPDPSEVSDPIGLRTKLQLEVARSAGLEKSLATTNEIQAQDRAIQIISQITSISTELFGSVKEFRESYDPEYCDDKYFVVVVETKLGPREAAQAERTWIKRVEEFSPNWAALRLSVQFV